MTRVPMGLSVALPAKEGFGNPMSPNQQKRYPNIQFSQFMGAEMMAEKYGLTKDDLDEFGYKSHQKAIAATQGGAFKDEILPIPIRDAEGADAVHAADEGIRYDVSLEGMRGVKLLREGGRITAATSSQICDGGASVARLSWGQYGARVGVPRIAALLERLDVRATFFVPAVTALIHPEEQRALIAAGHEIGLHGWIHELNTALPPEAERELMFRAADTLETITGVRPVGLRTPSWDFSPSTLAIEKELGLAYDSSLMADEDCYELMMDGEATGIVELPVEWIRDDAPYLAMNRSSGKRPYTPPADVLDIYRREFDGAWSGRIFQLTLHLHLIVYPSRIWILDELIGHGKATGDVWFATHAEVAAWALANAV
jgi:peptidoglycan/xylan/chitin deacetylase (PgdA/CDA1 family)